jgi:uncharacterized protein YgbK (DUF1537 family)
VLGEDRGVEQLLIIADDLTGAADSAARCRGAGLTASVLLEPGTLSLSAQAVALSTDSRMLPSAVAAQRVQEVVGKLVVTGKTRWYKKIDSTLRGNLGSELAVLLCHVQAVTGRRTCAVVSPGFPAQERGLENGYLVHAQTPARTVSLPELLVGQSNLPVALLSLDLVRQGVAALAKAMAATHEGGAEVLVVDGLNEQDLATIVAAAELALPNVLFAGSAGMVEMLAREMVTAKVDGTIQQAVLPHPILAVIGSGSTMAQRQVAYACSQPQVVCLQVEPEQGTQGRIDRQPHQVVVLHLRAPSATTLLEGPRARRLAEQLAEEALRFYRAIGEAVWVVSGGDTAAAVSRIVGLYELQVVCELLPGMPLTTGCGTDGERHWMVLKSGNHGVETSLVDLFDLLIRSQEGE